MNLAEHCPRHLGWILDQEPIEEAEFLLAVDSVDPPEVGYAFGRVQT